MDKSDVEHSPLDIDLTQRLLSETAPYFGLTVATTSKQASELLDRENFDLVLADLRMPDMNALDLLRSVRQRGLRVPFIIVTGKGDEPAAVAALKLGAYDYIVKREDYLTQLPYEIENAIARSQLVAANRQLQSELAHRERTEAQLRQAQKMESIGQLARGVAHDFNNLLTVINGYADLLFMQLDPQHPDRAGLAQIRKAGERAADLTRQLLAFRRKQILQPRVLTLNSLITDSTKMLERLLGEEVDLITLRFMSGRELASRVHELRPAMRVLFMSGYANEAVVRLGFLESNVPSIQKLLLQPPSRSRSAKSWKVEVTADNAGSANSTTA